MAINIKTDRELDQIESFRAARKIPLSMEIAINGDPDYFDYIRKYDLYGLSKYRITRMMVNNRIDRGVAIAIDRMSQSQSMSYADRIAHVLSLIDPSGSFSFVDLRPFLDSSLPDDSTHQSNYQTLSSLSPALPGVQIGQPSGTRAVPGACGGRLLDPFPETPSPGDGDHDV